MLELCLAILASVNTSQPDSDKRVNAAYRETKGSNRVTLDRNERKQPCLL